MAVRWRADGRLLCAAKSEPKEGDTYIDDRLHYYLSVQARVLVADVDHEINRLWYWIHGEGAETPRLRARLEGAVLAEKDAGQ